MRSFRHLTAAAAFACLVIGGAGAEEDYESWAPLVNPFESTGGGGIMIAEYRPVIIGNRCVTNFTATEPEPGGKIYYNKVEFDTVAVQAASCAPTAGGKRSTAACRA